MKKLNIEECHARLLKIAEIFDIICKDNGIPYYMLGGTMLGAIRHKGFIPWDDDMDFGVPRKYYKDLIDIFDKKLPNPYKYHTYNNSDAVIYPFLKIEDSTTLINDSLIGLPIDKQLGLNIDIFPLDLCNLDDKQLKWIQLLLKFNQFVFLDSPNAPYINCLKKIIRKLIPFNSVNICNKCDSILSNINKGSYLANIYGRWKMKEIIPIDYYGENVRYPFDKLYLCGLKNYDEYLTQLYGDYMQLPPVEKQKSHFKEVYIKRNV